MSLTSHATSNVGRPCRAQTGGAALVEISACSFGLWRTGIAGWGDADFAGDLVSRRSSSGLVLLFGRHCLKTSSSVQEPIWLSSGESEFYACVKGGAALLVMRSLMLDWGVCPKLTVEFRTDSSAAKGFATRRGLGRQRHVSTRFVKSIPPTTENWLRKRYNHSMNNDKSTEDKHETNHINNKCNDMNMNTRKMHIT